MARQHRGASRGARADPQRSDRPDRSAGRRAADAARRGDRGGPDDAAVSLREARRRFEREYIATVLEQHQWRMSDAARTLGIERANLYRKARQLGISREDMRRSGRDEHAASRPSRLSSSCLLGACSADGIGADDLGAQPDPRTRTIHVGPVGINPSLALRDIGRRQQRLPRRRRIRNPTSRSR